MRLWAISMVERMPASTNAAVLCRAIALGAAPAPFSRVAAIAFGPLSACAQTQRLPPIAPPGLHHFPNTLRGQRQFAWLDPECAQRIRHRICHDAACRDDAAFACALGT